MEFVRFVWLSAQKANLALQNIKILIFITEVDPGGGEILRTHLDRPWGPPSLPYIGYRGLALTTHPI
jgi:hypothetical protein